MTLRAHINHVLSSHSLTLRQLMLIKWSLPSHALNTLITGLVHSQLDYCNIVSAGLPACNFQHLQSILNTAVHLVAGSSRRDHVTSLLRDRHWLPVKRVQAVYDCSPLFVRRRTVILGRSYHSICCCEYESRSEISSVDDRCHHSSATAGPRPWNKLHRHTSVWCSLLTLLDVILKLFLFHQAFLSWHC